MLQPLALWQCPLCELVLTNKGQQWKCENNHSYDVAKEGYVNLLLPQHKNSKSPGDSKEMVVARRAFLSEHHYRPLAHKISNILTTTLTYQHASLSPFSIFDGGCGEGYYLSTIAENLLSQNNQCYTFGGIDIAKPAVQKASKNNRSYKHATFEFAVASCFKLPVIEASQDAVMQIFAPSKPQEINRILKQDGIWINVTPASDHLYELKSMVYDNPQQHTPSTINTDGFELLSAHTLKFEIHLNDVSQRQNLLMMTPFYWTISADKKTKLLEQLTLTHAHFDINVFRKTKITIVDT